MTNHASENYTNEETNAAEFQYIDPKIASLPSKPGRATDINLQLNALARAVENHNHDGDGHGLVAAEATHAAEADLADDLDQAAFDSLHGAATHSGGGTSQLSFITDPFGAVSSGSTNYLSIATPWFTTSEGEAKTPIRAGTLKNLRVFSIPIAGTPGTATEVITIRKNGADTALSVTLAGDTRDTTVSDTTHTVAFAAGDLLSVKIVTNVHSDTSPMPVITVELE